MAEVYLSLGSNLGDRLAFLTKAVHQIEQKLATKAQVSPVFSSPSWGFLSESFYNICLSLETDKSPQEVLACLLSIERDLGRVRSKKTGYQDRVIDIDILFYGDLILDTENLSLPHPEAQNRRFALLPLSKIAPNFVHPVLQKTISELLLRCEDSSELTQLATDLPNGDARAHRNV